jgi:hypothetical protein
MNPNLETLLKTFTALRQTHGKQIEWLEVNMVGSLSEEFNSLFLQSLKDGNIELAKILLPCADLSSKDLNINDLEIFFMILLKDNNYDLASRIVPYLDFHKILKKFSFQKSDFDPLFFQCVKTNNFNSAEKLLFYMDINKSLNKVDDYNVNAMLNDGSKYPLFCATVINNLEAVKFLVNKGADIEVQNVKKHETALFLAFSLGFLDICKFLMSKGAKTSFTYETNGKTSEMKLSYLVPLDGIRKYTAFFLELLEDNRKQMFNIQKESTGMKAICDNFGNVIMIGYNVEGKCAIPEKEGALQENLFEWKIMDVFSHPKYFAVNKCNEVIIIKRDNLKNVARLGDSENITHIDFSPNGTCLAFNDDTVNRIFIYDIEEGKIRNCISMHKNMDTIINFKFLNESQILINTQNTTYCYNVTTGVISRDIIE